MELTLFLLGLILSYVALSFWFWTLCRMLAVTDKRIESRAAVLPFKRG